MKQIVTITGEHLMVVANNVESAAAEKKTKAQMRIEALKAAGVDVSNYFTLGDDKLVKIENGTAVPVDMDDATIDAVGKKIVEGGYVNNWKLFRRWVMSQMFHMLRQMETGRDTFNEILQRKGYEYQWDVIEREMYAQMKMIKHGDAENAGDRNLWFNGMLICEIAEDYIENNLIYKNKYDTKKSYKHTCKGMPYIRLMNKDIFVADLEKKVYAPLKKLATEMYAKDTYEDVYKAVKKFNKIRKHLAWNTKQSDLFISAYKGSGAYYTMRNLIMYHRARFKNGGRKLSDTKSLEKLDKLALEYSNEGWRMLGVLKQLIKDNGISVQGKIDEWKKK